MAKNLLLISIILFFAVSVKAQYVNIPDPHFRDYLKMHYPSCFNGSDMMDTTCSPILNETNLYTEFWLVTDLEGVQYFKSLKRMNCQQSQITHLPSLPPSLIYLDCYRNQLTTLPDLPSGLVYLNCAHNQLTSLPKLTNSLEYLSCDENNISCLPILPTSLRSVHLDSAKIHCVPNYTDAGFFNHNILNGGSDYIVMPVCNTANNLNSCIVPPFSIHGKVFYDNNSNGIFDGGDCSKTDFKVSLSGNSMVYNDSANYQGSYLFMPETSGSYNLTTETPPEFYKVIPAFTSINFTDPATTVVQDIALQSNLDNPDSLFITGNGGFVLGGFYNPMLFPNHDSWNESGSITLEYENRGPTTISPIITVNYDSSLIRYTFSSNAGVVDNGKTLVLNESNLAPGEHKTVTLYFYKDATNGNPNLGGSFWNLVTLASIVSNGMGNVIAINNQVIVLLPLKLTTFNALVNVDNSASLSWSTNNEINTQSFNLEQSTDGLHFTSIATVPAKKQNNNSYNYKTDALTTNAVTYFRLKMIDIDGNFTYSSIIKVGVPNDTKSTIEVFPNPANKWIKIRVTALEIRNSSAKLFNSQGALVKRFTLQQGVQTIDLSNLTGGIYFLQTPFGSKKIMVVK